MAIFRIWAFLVNIRLHAKIGNPSSTPSFLLIDYYWDPNGSLLFLRASQDGDF